MIAQKTIEDVRSKVDVFEVVSKFVTLKKHGANYTGCCPFHNEKSPSFSVSVAKQIYKCFGCGRGGDAITFVMEHEKKPFGEAIEWLAAFYGIGIEYDGKLDASAIQERKDQARARQEVLQYAEQYYHRQLMEAPDDAAVWQALRKRGYGRPEAISWRFGFAPDQRQNLAPHFINKGLYTAAAEVSLLRTNDGVSYDFYRNRLIIPIRDTNGVIAGFGGRALADGEKAKYLNPAESDTYLKKETLFGLHEAKPGIRSTGYAYMVEGYFDVTTLHLCGVANAVAPCGTALTVEQVRLLKRHTGHAVLLGDADAAGKTSMMKSIDLLLQHDMRVQVVVLPPGEDPDSWARKHSKFLNQADELQPVLEGDLQSELVAVAA